MRSELQSHNVSSRRCSHERGVQQERFVQNLEYWKAQLRGQLQNEKLIMTSLKQSFQETSENERQAVISAQQLASSLQSEMSEATTACDSRRRDRLTMEVTEQKRRRQLGGTPRMTHLLICHHQEEIVRNASGRQKIHSPYQPLRAAEGNLCEHIPSTSTALSDMRSVTDETSKNEKKQIISNLNFWAQASKFSYWKVSFHREVTTGSAHPRTIGGWFAEIDMAVGTQEFDCSGFIFCTHYIAPSALCTRNIFSRAAQERFVAHCVST